MSGCRPFFTKTQPDMHRLKKLEEDAIKFPRDPARQAAFLKELIRFSPEGVVERYESKKFASNDEAAAVYRDALQQTGRHDRYAPASDPHYDDGFARNFGPSPSGPFGSSGPFDKGRGGAPLQVMLVEPSAKYYMWNILRSIIIVVGSAGLLLYLLKEQGFSKAFAAGMGGEVQPSKESVKRFTDVKGCDEAKAELEEIVAFLRDPKKFTRLGGKLPKGILLVGPPGTGKTLLARAIAGEANVPFFYASGSEFEELFVGVGARRVRDLFAAAKKKSPCIIFIDEIDAVGAKRNPKDQQVMRMTLNQLLAELDGFKSSEGIIVLAATNFPQSLDKALTRPGRFDRTVIVPVPDVSGRQQILDLHLKSIPKAADVDTHIIARGTPGFTGADLANLVNIAALKASTEAKDRVYMNDLDFAKDRVMMGAERKSMKIDEHNRRNTAYHEAGHALVAINTPGADPVHKATIIPRGPALGMVMQLPDGDQLSQTRKQLLAKLDVCMGGRVAEELILGHDEITTGASSDLESATRIARAMVTSYGMSESLGPVNYEDAPFMGERDTVLSSETKEKIESEVKAILQGAYKRAKHILTSHESDLHKLAKALLEKETLSGHEIVDLVRGVPSDKRAAS